MTRPCRRLVAAVLLGVAGSAAAQEQDLPPGAQVLVLDIVFKVEDLGGQVVDFEVKETDTEVRIELAADVLFDFDQATLLPKAEDTLTKAAAFIRERSARAARIEGHTDGKGSVAYNQRLSTRRAESVRRWFAGHGLGGLTLSVAGYGATRPVSANTRPDGSDDPEGRRKNRRVEIVIGK